MPELARFRRPLPPAALDALRGALLGSPLVGRSTLGGSFRASRGFAVTFTLAGQGALLARYPSLEPYLRFALSARVQRALLPVHTRWRRGAFLAANAFYLNLLLLEPGQSVGRHVDATLRGPSGVAEAVPERVFVLYLLDPRPRQGGQLACYRADRRVAWVRPREGAALVFRGDLAHEVKAFEAPAASPLRASLVLEQYAFGDQPLAQLPPFKVESKAGFAAYLAEHHRQPRGSKPR